MGLERFTEDYKNCQDLFDSLHATMIKRYAEPYGLAALFGNGFTTVWIRSENGIVQNGLGVTRAITSSTELGVGVFHNTTWAAVSCTSDTRGVSSSCS